MKASKIQIKIKPKQLTTTDVQEQSAAPAAPTAPVVPIEDVQQQTPHLGMTCQSCGERKPPTEFYKRVNTKCKECVKKEQRERNAQNKEKQQTIQSDPNVSKQPKKCPGCNQMRTAGDFRINRAKCQICERKYGREYNRENPEIREKWVAENIDHLHDLQAKWYQKNKVHVLMKNRERFLTDDHYRVTVEMKKKLNGQLRRATFSAEFCGTKVSLIKQWLEYNFDETMNWDNYGTYWEVDHVIPTSWYDLTQQSEIDNCYDWKNFSPLSKSDNQEKSNSVVMEQLNTHIEKLRSFIDQEQIDTNLETFLEYYKQKLNSVGETP